MQLQHVGGLLHAGHGIARLGGKAPRAQDVAGRHTSASDRELTQGMALGPDILGCSWGGMDILGALPSAGLHCPAGPP